MYKVRSKRSGQIYVVYGVSGNLIMLWKGAWVWEQINFYEPLEE